MNNKLQQINKQAAANASRALSKMIDRPVSIEINKAEVKEVEKLSPIIGPEEIVAGIYLPIAGDVKGASLLIFPQKTSFALCDLLVRREPGTTRKLTEFDESAITVVFGENGKATVSGGKYGEATKASYKQEGQRVRIENDDMYLEALYDGESLELWEDRICGEVVYVVNCDF